MEAIWRRRSRPIVRDDPYYNGDLETNTLRECEDLVNNPRSVNFEYVAEGRANVVFSIWESCESGARKGRFEGTLLRVPKATPGVTPCDYNTLQDFHENQVEEHVGRQHLVPQVLIHISDEVAEILHKRRNKADESEIRAGYAMLIQDMSASPGYSVLEFKPKWLAQSPIASSGAKRCRTCAREAFRNHQKQAEGHAVSVPICPLGLVHENPEVVMDTIRRLAPEWTEQSHKRLSDAFDKSGILEKLRELQTRGDPDRALLDDPSDSDFGLAMTLRDCSCYVRMPDDVNQDLEIKLADVDKKNWEEKQTYWRETHWNLVDNGWYTCEEQVNPPVVTAYLVAISSPSEDLKGGEGNGATEKKDHDFGEGVPIRCPPMPPSSICKLIKLAWHSPKPVLTMAFNFNWSPLAADAEFYKRAQELLTSALNKYPKPPIIVDDILVTEFNLGSVPPDLEILEIGDLAEDRFRGIFKMCYSGDAFLTLRTKVQANPLNTYLSAKPTFTSPQPLAASAGLTIPLSITLSEIKLSAFIILVFSKQKGLTLVFRNDPLESLKVSSTFDSIQFVRDYLQRTIEGQLRNLMMDELPAIIHKLSLRLWCPDQIPRDEEIVKENVEDEAVVDPFANPPVEAVDSYGHVLDADDVASLSLDCGSGPQSLFSQKNMLRLAALTDSHRTLSLFTPGIRDAMFRAWAGPTDRHDAGVSTPVVAPTLYRMPSTHGSSTIYTFTDTGSMDQGSVPSRPSMVSLNSATAGLTLGAGKHSRNLRKKKTRVVNLRRPKTGSETSSDMGDTMTDTVSVTAPVSEPILPTSIPEEIEEEMVSPQNSTRARFGGDKRPTLARAPLNMDIYEEPIITDGPPPTIPTVGDKMPSSRIERALRAAASSRRPGFEESMPANSDTSSVMLEQAWIMKMADEIARRVYDEKQRKEKMWEEGDEAPPPAYQPTQLFEVGGVTNRGRRRMVKRPGGPVGGIAAGTLGEHIAARILERLGVSAGGEGKENHD
ncbi:hypothetical protein O1611_g1913 [Lasiodiplodia mahajangana]|uniref:Uncharacterized protein n=1 Tax=Lasiodiplodia mahajangana TaxID=1108764 RepID=A0ACC2JW75_9PEZI|nr:hypothetical protein O1611_g1913 [Lasiodiplodia mahajangana]